MMRLNWSWVAPLSTAMACALLLGVAHAQSKKERKNAPPPAAEKASSESKKAAASKKVLKMRPESLLRRDDPVGGEVDLRGAIERRRDFEIIRHFTRIAELDVIHALAQEMNDGSLRDRVVRVQRKEQRRYWAAMQRMKEWSLRRAQRGAL